MRRRPCCASLAPAPYSGSHAQQLLPSTVPTRPPGPRPRLSPRALRLLGRRCSRLHRSPRRPSSARSDCSAAWRARDCRSTGQPTVRAFGGRSRLLCPLLTSALRSAALRRPQSRLPGRRRRPPEVRPTAFTAHPPDLPPQTLMAVDFAIICSLVLDKNRITRVTQAQGRRREAGSEGSVEQSRDPMLR